MIIQWMVASLNFLKYKVYLILRCLKVFQDVCIDLISVEIQRRILFGEKERNKLKIHFSIVKTLS